MDLAGAEEIQPLAAPRLDFQFVASRCTFGSEKPDAYESLAVLS
jgi:hypothetical protein